MVIKGKMVTSLHYRDMWKRFGFHEGFPILGICQIRLSRYTTKQVLRVKK